MDICWWLNVGNDPPFMCEKLRKGIPKVRIKSDENHKRMGSIGSKFLLMSNLKILTTLSTILIRKKIYSLRCQLWQTNLTILTTTSNEPIIGDICWTESSQYATKYTTYCSPVNKNLKTLDFKLHIPVKIFGRWRWLNFLPLYLLPGKHLVAILFRYPRRGRFLHSPWN